MAKEENISKRVAQFKVKLKAAITMYLMITKPMHKLGDKQIEILTEILYLYTKEQGNFARQSDAWKIVFGRDNLANIREKLDMGKQVFNNYLYGLRKMGIIVNNEVSPKYNPLINKGCNIFELTFKFVIEDD